MLLINKTGHPSLDIVSSDGDELDDKKIILCISGSVAVYKAIELARLLMRHGADVTCVASNAATKLVKPDYFKWATGNSVITRLTGDMEHIKLADYNNSDLIVVYPATANTLGKLANGIDDTPISTILTVGFGSKIPIVMCLAMHAAMYENVSVQRNISFLKNKIQFLEPNMIEGKAKVPEPQDVLDHILDMYRSRSPLANKKILLTAGSTVEHIDPVRVITNQSSGKTGALLAGEFIKVGAKVTMIYGQASEPLPKGVQVIRVSTSKEMSACIMKQLRQRFDVIVMAAAVSDYTPKTVSKSKINSTKQLTIQLRPTPKIIDQIRERSRDAFVVGFKAEADVSDDKLIRAAKTKLHKSKVDIIIANDIGTRYKKNPNNNRVLIIDDKSIVSSRWQKKEKIVRFICKEIEKRYAQNNI